MERPNTVSGLVEKRRQLQAELKAAEKSARNIRIDLDHLDAAIRLFTEDAPRRPPSHSVLFKANKGEVQRFVLGQFRRAKRPLTSLDVTTAFLEGRGMVANEANHTLVRKRIGSCLNTLKHRGVIKEIPLEACIRAGSYANNPNPIPTRTAFTGADQVSPPDRGYGRLLGRISDQEAWRQCALPLPSSYGEYSQERGRVAESRMVASK